MFKPHYHLPYLKWKEAAQEIRIHSAMVLVSLWEMWLFLPLSGGRTSLLLLERISTGICANLLARIFLLGIFWLCCPHWLSRNHLSLRIPQLTVDGAGKEPDPVMPSLKQTWLLEEGLSIWFSFRHFFLFFSDKLIDQGIHLAMAQFRLYIITWQKKCEKPGKVWFLDHALSWTGADLLSGPRSATSIICNFMQVT